MNSHLKLNFEICSLLESQYYMYVLFHLNWRE